MSFKDRELSNEKRHTSSSGVVLTESILWLRVIVASVLRALLWVVIITIPLLLDNQKNKKRLSGGTGRAAGGSQLQDWQQQQKQW